MAIKVLTLDGLKHYTTQFKAWITDKFVAKEAGKGLSTNDYTTAEKEKLAGIAEQAQVNVLEGVQVNGSDLVATDKKVNIDLSAYALKADIVNAMYFRGVVATYAALPGDAENGDIYHVEENAGEYIWIAEKNEWQALGAILDLSAYSTTAQMNDAIALAIAPLAKVEDVYTKTDVDGKVQELNGAIALKANSADVYTQTDVDGKLALKADVSALNGAVETINTEMAKKAVQTEVDGALALKADASAVYIKSEVDSALALKANAADVYNKSEVDGKVKAVDDKFVNYVLATDLVAIENSEIDAECFA